METTERRKQVDEQTVALEGEAESVCTLLNDLEARLKGVLQPTPEGVAEDE